MAPKRTFDIDFDDVVNRAQLVLGRAVVIPSVRFIHVRNLQDFTKVVERHPVIWKLSPHLLPGDVRRGPIAEDVTFSDMKD